MDMRSNNFVPPPDQLHVAQQSRRQKLRVSHSIDGGGGGGGGFSGYFPAGIPLEVMNNFQSTAPPPFADVVHPSRFVVPTNDDTYDATTFQGGCHDFKPFTSDNHGLMLPHFTPDHSSDFQNNVCKWVNNGANNNNNELPLLPSFVNESGSSHHGLSLSLSSNQPGGGEIKSFESGVVSSSVVNPIQDMIGTVSMFRSVGPLGPFTGYTTILKNSKFLKPAQQLLDEFLSMAGLRSVRGSQEGESISGNVHSSCNVGGCSSDVASMRSRGGVGGGGLIEFGNGSGSCESYRPDCHEKKAKLIQMQEEVCKRHKQYHQQMEMVMSAFESVPGLGNATPFISRSLKMISRHFRCIKNVIAGQLKHIRKVLGEDISSSSSMAKCESSNLRFEHNFPKVKSGGFGGMSYSGQQNHIWRPQRGLPERAVSILRAWLFDHFLHPYPTDTDKQMLATQTGLSRNQVSNWFINARVRLWKPMVEEIHMLETKGGSRSEPSSNSNGMTPISGIRQAGSNQADCKQAANMMCDKQFECMGSSSSIEGCRGETSAEQLFQKRSRMETHQIPTSMDGTLLGFLPYQRRGLEMGGLGAVSLTLGLRHGSENTQQQLQHQFQQQGLHFGSHVIHDFSG